nr:hypothetical protein [Tanacetum cinerariifolium]
MLSFMGELTFFLGLQVKQKEDGIFISHDKYVAEIMKKFNFISVKTAITLSETKKPLVKDGEAADVDAHLYKSMIGSLMYLTASRPDIMYAVCACSRFQVTPKTSHLHAVKRIFRYLKGQPKLGLGILESQPLTWKPTQIVTMLTVNPQQEVVNFLNQMFDHGINFMNTMIYIDNESTICIIKNPVFHSKTKHIEIRHHFIRDAYEKKLIQVLKIHTNDNVADLLTKAFDVSRHNVSTVWSKLTTARKKLASHGNFNKLDDLVDKGADYAVNKGRSDKIKVINDEAKSISTVGKTLSTATLAVSTVSVQEASISTAEIIFLLSVKRMKEDIYLQKKHLRG